MKREHTREMAERKYDQAISRIAEFELQSFPKRTSYKDNERQTMWIEDGKWRIQEEPMDPSEKKELEEALDFILECEAHYGFTPSDFADRFAQKVAEREEQLLNDARSLQDMLDFRESKDGKEPSRIVQFEIEAAAIEPNKKQDEEISLEAKEVDIKGQDDYDGIMVSEGPYEEMQIMGFISDQDLEKEDDSYDLER